MRCCPRPKLVSLDNDLSTMKMKMFVEDKAGHKESKYMRDLDKRKEVEV